MPKIQTRPHPGRRKEVPAGAIAIGMLALVLAAGPVHATDPAPSPSASASASPGPSSAPAPTPSPTPTPKPPTIRFYGRGYGHGLGMSQYGARGRALAGQTAAAILAHYYANSTLGTMSASTQVRVLITTGFTPTTATPARVVATGDAFTVDGMSGTWPAGASVTLVRVTSPATGWTVRIVSAGGSLLERATSSGSVRIRPASSKTRLDVLFEPTAYHRYRGVIRLLGSAGGRVSAINELKLETYLRGVIPSEMPSSWPTQALRAQAIAARSFAAAHLHPSSGSWDVYDDTRSQVYRGALGEATAPTSAVTATAGGVLRAGSKVITALFHSSDGGATEHNENVYVSATGQIVATPLAYLRGSADRSPAGIAYDAAAPHATWQTASYTYAALSTVFARDARTNVGSLTAINLSRRGVSGRLISVTLTGSAGSRTVSGEIFRTVFNRYTPATDPCMWSTLVAAAPIP